DRQPTQLAEQNKLILPDRIREQLNALPALLASDEAQAVIVRGPRRNGRRTVLGAVASMLGRGVLEIKGLNTADDERWKLVGPLATLLGGLRVVGRDLAPGETAELPGWTGCAGAL